MVAPINLNLQDFDYTNSNNNIIIGGDGDDVIYSYGDNNTIEGNDGQDTIVSYGNNNTITDSEGQSQIYSNGYGNNIRTGNEADNVVIIGDNNTIRTNGGNDLIKLAGNNNNVDAGDGDDEIRFSGSHNAISGGNGNDKIIQMSRFGSQTNISDWGRGVWGDPHYEIKGSNGKEIKFDHHGIAGHTYEVFSGDNIIIDGKYAPSGNAPCVISETTVTAGADEATFDKNGNATINGQVITDGDYTLEDGTQIKIDGKTMTVIPSDGSGQVVIRAQGSEMIVDPSGEFGNLGGIIGTAISQNKALSEAEADKFDVTGQTREPQETEDPFAFIDEDPLSVLLGI